MRLVTLTTEDEYREAAVELAVYAVNGYQGRPHLGDPVYESVTEHRQADAEKSRHQWDGQSAEYKAAHPKPFYSSCGDLCHWMLYRLGVRLPWVNRDENRPARPDGWRVGWNITYLVQPANPCGAPIYPPSFSPKPGDIIHQRGAFDHVRVCVAFDGKSLSSCDYGQPGGAQKLSTWDGAGKLNKASALHCLSLREVLADAKRKGKLEPQAEVPGSLEDADTIPPPPPSQPTPVEVPHPSLPPVLAPRTLRRGDSGPDVRLLQARLYVAQDGKFGPATEAAVKAYQREHGLLPDGLVGPVTWRALGAG